MELNEKMEELMEEEFSKEEKKHNIFCNYEPYSFVASENGNVLGMITGYTSYEEVYIDEYQDRNTVQETLLKAIAEAEAAAEDEE